MDHSNSRLEALHSKDPTVYQLICQEAERQLIGLELIASENYTSLAVREAQGSVLTHKYAEGYPNKRYYGGCTYVDGLENLAIDRAKQLFGCAYANVQPHSGSQANQAVFLALLKPGDTILGMDIKAGGHLTHGHTVSLSGQWFHAVAYGVDSVTHRVDMDNVRDLALKHRPKLIIAGASSYSRELNFEEFGRIAKEIGAWLLVDMAHIAGLVATGHHPHPFPHAHVVTTTTHKTLRGPRGGLILTQESDMAKAIDRAVFPGLQGGPLMHVVAAKAVAFGEALDPSFKNYIHHVCMNSRALCGALDQYGWPSMTQGTDNHMFVLDLRLRDMTGMQAQKILESVHINSNKNGLPQDPLPPQITSGLRLGTPALSTRGCTVDHMKDVAHWIHRALSSGSDHAAIESVSREVTEFARALPLWKACPV